MKLQGFVLLIIFLNIFRSGYSLAVAPQNEMQFPGERVFSGFLVNRNSPDKQGFTVFIGYFEKVDDAYPSRVCSGNIITAEYIVSTAVCLDNTGLTEDDIGVYITGLQGTRYDRTVINVYINKHYNADSLANNVAVAQVNEPYDFTTGELFPVKLPHKSWGPEQFTRKPLTVCGYRNPYTTDNFYVFEPTCFPITPRERDYCNAELGREIEDDEICASSSNMAKYSVCLQDYGAGLIYVKKSSGPPYKFYLYAIASYNDPYDSCAEGPTVFFLINGVLDWINSITGEGE